MHHDACASLCRALSFILAINLLVHYSCCLSSFLRRLVLLAPSYPSRLSYLPSLFLTDSIRPTDLIGNVYARFKYEDSAQAACDALNSRWYAGRPIYCELSPVTDFREACCRLNSGEGCVRGGFCNFIHRKEPSAELDRELELSTKKWLRARGRDQRSVTRTPSPEPSKKRY